MQNLEQLARDAAKNHEVEYNPQHWQELEQKLNKISTAPRNNYLLKSAAVLTAILAGSAVIYFSNIQNETPSNTPQSDVTGIKSQSLPQETAKATEIEVNANEIKAEVASPVTLYKVKNTISDIQPAKQNTSSVRATENATGEDDGSGENPETEAMIAPEVLISETEVCEGETVSFEILNAQPDYKYSWKIRHEVFNSASFESVFLPGTYHIVLTSIAHKNGKDNRSQKTYQVKVNPKPVAAFLWKEEHNGSNSISLTDASQGAASLTWDFGDNQLSTEVNPIHAYAIAGAYTVKLTAQNANGCISTTSQMVTVKDNNPLLAPNAFSPDGDGINETFIPRKLEIIDTPFELTIFDRKGVVVYKTTDRAKPWNGRINNTGDRIQLGTSCIWVVILKSETGKEQRYTGQVNIIK